MLTPDEGLCAPRGGGFAGMSDEAVVALAAVVVSGVVGVATLWFNFWNSSREREHRLAEREQDNRELYRRTMFEKRLEAIQEAKRWLNRLWEGMYGPDADDRGVPIGQAVDWYDKNVVSIHIELPDKSPLGTFLYDTEWAMAQGGEWPKVEAWRKANEFILQAAREVLKGLTEAH